MLKRGGTCYFGDEDLRRQYKRVREVDVHNGVADITSIATLTSAFNNSVSEFPSTGGTVFQYLALHASATGMSTTIDLATADVKALPVPVSEADGQLILTAAATLTPMITDTLNNIVAKKAAFIALPFSIQVIGMVMPVAVPALVKQDLIKGNASASALSSALVALMPADLVPAGSILKNQVDTAFAQTIAAYT
ncbi:putative hydrophobic surface binding protein [Lyophyllum shimeji]|uniref:Hydrophobic surface binding protein n=1 Tax=Lyophyllum shimeji TaxID=47721 RepID=A0A9P3ULX2_LYOSH|nr:putative hydrophobic surface binding protein [Lyophyllum shimeji]